MRKSFCNAILDYAWSGDVTLMNNTSGRHAHTCAHTFFSLLSSRVDCLIGQMSILYGGGGR